MNDLIYTEPIIDPDFKQIPGWPGYAVSKYGEVKSLYRKREFPSKTKGLYYIREYKETYLKYYSNRDGYYAVQLKDSGRNKKITIHRLVAITWLNNPENHPSVNHKDGNKRNNHVDNLEWCTIRHNIQHSFKIGLSKKGSDVKNSILNKKCAIAIKNMLSLGFTRKYIASIFEVSIGAVSYMTKGWSTANPSSVILPRMKRANGRPVCLLNSEGKPIKYWKSATKAANEMGLSVNLILDVANGKQANTKGHVFSFPENIKTV